MLLVRMLMPRFLVLEIVLFFHVVHHGWACMKKEKLVKAVNTGMKVILDANGYKYNPTTAMPPARPTRRPVAPVSGGSGCPIDLHTAGLKNVPLFFKPDGEFMLPAPSAESLRARVLTFEQGSSLSCPGARIKALGKTAASIDCLEGGAMFRVSGEDGETADVVFEELTCSRSIREKIVKMRESPCGPANAAGHWSHIGWQHNKRFMPQISVCHDSSKEQTFFTNHTVYGAAIDAKETESGRPSHFKEGGFYDLSSADTSYKLRTQEKTFATLLGASRAPTVFNSRTSFLAKGHLAPDADFIYKEWQDATYYFVNVAPQWQAFNNGNWKAVEFAVRTLAATTGSNYDVYTGTLGQLSLEDSSGQPQKLFLGRKVSNNEETPFNLIPVPEFYWKILHDPLADEAIVFVGLNNPFFEGDAEREVQICPDVCASAKWFLLYQTSVAKGYTYCCSYEDFKAVIEWAPELGQPDLLENQLVF